jgi:hypothetical protein
VRRVLDAEPKVEALVIHLQARALNEKAQHWLTVLREAYSAEPQQRGGMSAWFNDHDSENVEVMQVTFDHRSNPTNVWTPGVRNAVWTPMGVRFFDAPTSHSDRRYVGIHTLAASETTYVGYDKAWMQVLIYHLVDEKQKV